MNATRQLFLKAFKSPLISKDSEKTITSDCIFSGKVLSVTEYQSLTSLKRIFTPKKNELGLKTRKTLVILEIGGNYIREVLEDGTVAASIQLSSVQFAMVPTKGGKRFQFTLQGYGNDGKSYVKRQYEVQTASELSIWYSQLNPEPHSFHSGSQRELFWREYLEMIQLIKRSVIESLEEVHSSKDTLHNLLAQL